jgi:hypothetical protein
MRVCEQGPRACLKGVSRLRATSLARSFARTLAKSAAPPSLPLISKCCGGYSGRLLVSAPRRSIFYVRPCVSLERTLADDITALVAQSLTVIRVISGLARAKRIPTKPLKSMGLIPSAPELQGATLTKRASVGS